MEFIEKLKEEHGVVVELLDKIGATKPGDENFRQNMTQCEEILIQHVIKEDSKIHPALEKAAEKNKKLSKRLKRTSDEMAEVTLCAVLFFQKYSKDTALKSKKKNRFTTDFKNLRKVLIERVKVEENYLFSEYEKIAKKNAKKGKKLQIN
ncbi:MAG: hemerythrin domain-containing protein [Magnetococcales bacterium]|nr:hemerythrin domain-containing protein [Magnetococcales bacterium]